MISGQLNINKEKKTVDNTPVTELKIEEQELKSISTEVAEPSIAEQQAGLESKLINVQAAELKEAKIPEQKLDLLEIKLSFRETGITNTGLLVLKFPSSADAKSFSQSIAEPLPEGMILRGQELTIKLYKNTGSGEYNFIFGTNQTVLNFLNGLGLQPNITEINPIADKTKKIKSLQVAYTYLGGLMTSYDAITPHALPEEMKYDEFYQRHKIYFSDMLLRDIKQEGLSLTIPRPGTLSPAKPYSRKLKIVDYFKTLPPKPSTSLASKLSSLISEQPIAAAALPGIEFRIAEKGAFVLTFDSEADARYAALKIGQFQLDENSPLAKILKKQIPGNINLIIPFINGNELRFPMHQNTQEVDCIYVGGNYGNFLRLFDPSFDKKQADEHALNKHFHADLKQKVIEIKDTEKLRQLKKKPDQVFKFIFPPDSPFLSPDKKIINEYIQNIQNSNRISQRAKNVMNGLLEFAAENKIDLTETAKQTHLVIPEHLKLFLGEFLAYKKRIEPKIFEKMTLDDFIKRLMTARPAMFVGSADQVEYWPDQKASDCLTYDEIPVAAMLISSSFTHFINEGGMDNNGEQGIPGTYQENGICMNVIGTRLEKALRCEYQHVIITPKQNTAENGYGEDADKKNHCTQRNNIWAKLYGLTHLPSYKEVKDLKNDPRYIDIGNNQFFNLDIYIKRTYMLLEAYLLEANQRAQAAGKQAYVHLMGFGNGAWSKKEVKPIQNRLFPMICDLVLKNNELKHISDIHFSFIKDLKAPYNKCGNAGDAETSTSGDNTVKMWFHDRKPTAKLTGEHQDKLLVRLYQGDGGCSPGNEFWKGSIAGSGEPAAIANSYVGLYQNPRINKDWLNEMNADNPDLYRGSKELPSIESLLKINWQAMVPTESPALEKKAEKVLKNKKDLSAPLPPVTAPQRPPVSDPQPGILPRLSLVGSTAAQQHVDEVLKKEETPSPEKIKLIMLD